jgi:hypothetical protein
MATSAKKLATNTPRDYDKERATRKNWIDIRGGLEGVKAHSEGNVAG